MSVSLAWMQNVAAWMRLAQGLDSAWMDIGPSLCPRMNWIRVSGEPRKICCYLVVYPFEAQEQESSETDLRSFAVGSRRPASQKLLYQIESGTILMAPARPAAPAQRAGAAGVCVCVCVLLSCTFQEASVPV